jgi:hypothetical protein
MTDLRPALVIALLERALAGPRGAPRSHGTGALPTPAAT